MRRPCWVNKFTRAHTLCSGQTRRWLPPFLRDRVHGSSSLPITQTPVTTHEWEWGLQIHNQWGHCEPKQSKTFPLTHSHMSSAGNCDFRPSGSEPQCITRDERHEHWRIQAVWRAGATIWRASNRALHLIFGSLVIIFQPGWGGVGPWVMDDGKHWMYKYNYTTVSSGPLV